MCYMYLHLQQIKMPRKEVQFSFFETFVWVAHINISMCSLSLIRSNNAIDILGFPLVVFNHYFLRPLKHKSCMLTVKNLCVLPNNCDRQTPYIILM